MGEGGDGGTVASWWHGYTATLEVERGIIC